MSNSTKLRKTLEEFGGGRSIFNEEAKSHEDKVYSIAVEIENVLRKKYNEPFFIEKQLCKSKIAESISIYNYESQGRNSFVKPDGGILYYGYSNNGIHKKYPILISEAKKQGTNDKREKEGKLKQGKGNAIERAYKNSKEFELYCRKFPVFPYVIFACGCDFEKGSSIIDRLDAITEYLPRNKIYVGTEYKIPSVFVQEKPFTKQFMFDTMLSIAEQSIKIIRKVNAKN